MVWRIFSAREWRFASLKGTDEILKTLGHGMDCQSSSCQAILKVYTGTPIS